MGGYENYMKGVGERGSGREKGVTILMDYTGFVIVSVKNGTWRLPTIVILAT